MKRYLKFLLNKSMQLITLRIILLYVIKDILLITVQMGLDCGLGMPIHV